MKKLLILSLISTVAFGKDTIRSTAKEIGGQFAEAVTIPVKAVKKVITENKIDEDFMDIVSAYPRFFKEQAEDVAQFATDTAKKVADSKFVAKVKKATDKAVTKTKKAATKVKDATISAGNNIKEAAIKTGDAIKNTANKVSKSEAVEDIKDVGHQLFVDAPVQFWAAVVAAAKAVKAEFTE